MRGENPDDVIADDEGEDENDPDPDPNVQELPEKARNKFFSNYLKIYTLYVCLFSFAKMDRITYVLQAN